jgi:hypothetical protein
MLHTHRVRMHAESWAYAADYAKRMKVSLDDAVDMIVRQHQDNEKTRRETAATMDKMRAAVEKRDVILKANGIIVQ